MAIYRNEGKGISVLVKTDYSFISLLKDKYINIDEKLVLRYPSSIKKYSDEEWEKINSEKQETKKAIETQPKQEVKEEKVESNDVIENAEEPKQEVATARKPRARKTKKGEENA